MFAVSVVPNPNPGVGLPASSCVLHSSGASLNALQIAFNRDTESRPACDCTPLIISVGEPLTPYFSLSSACMLNSGNRPFSHSDSSSRFLVISNSVSVVVVHVVNCVVSIPTSVKHAAPSSGVPVFPKKHVR